jgi:xylulokinase
VCDVFGKKVLKPKVSDASFGSALLAGVGSGVFTDLTDAVEKCCKVEREYRPIEENSKKYIKLFDIYMDIHNGLADIYKELSKVIN